ncbi:hypothetical protein HS088_TW10G00784 [Tripterygium wilfordii]|uniref:Uncharacterized protein n=1 Tax=Tripterygium wilfordii TaxID=458696 RepID=A0A7J7D643_TRIWF|nr:uncharacterized protein LOC120007731 [Tripterygium wilfordii]KAF5741778.1 hypothetical protein HS088_TW10G00784 [Tripterygium wilfordii]
MKMVLADIHIEAQLIETGNSLLNPPSSIVELLSLLDKAEHLLSNVDQAPSRATQDAMLPMMKALVSNDILRHSDMDVKVSVADCISEITRITAPDAPYDDDLMKECFQLSVAALENLSLVSGRCYTKAISILDTLARCRSCLVMLDLECDSLIIKMFQIFLKVIRSNHPYVVFMSMEAVMTVVIDESEEVSADLLNPLLASVRKENQSVSPMSWKLGEKVLVSCASKLQPYLKDAVQSIGIALDEYAPIVAAICENKTNTLDNDNGSGYVVHLEECRLVNGEGSIELPEKMLQEEHRLVNGEGSIEPPEVKEELSPDTASKSESENVPFKRGRKPNSFLNPEEGYDYSWIFKDKKTPKAPGCVKSRDKGSDHSTSKTPVSENIDLTSRHDRGSNPKGYTSKVSEGNQGIDAASPIPEHSLPDKSRPKRGRPRKNKNLVNQAVDPNPSSVLKGENLGAEDEEKCSQSTDNSMKKKPEENSKLKNVAIVKKVEILSKPEKETAQLSISKAGDSSSVPKDVYRSFVDSVSDRNTTEASGSKSISKSGVKSSNKDGNQLEETSKSKLKRKRSMRKEVGSGTPYHGDQLVGRTIKVLWPMDKAFYKGVVDSYDPVKERHKVLYADGDIETLNLRKESWELVGDDVLPHEGRVTDLPKVDNPPDRLEKQKGKKRKMESGKQRSAERSGATAGTFAVKARKYSGKTNKAVQVDTSVEAETRTDNLKDDNKESTGKLSMETPGISLNNKKTILENLPLSKKS